MTLRSRFLLICSFLISSLALSQDSTNSITKGTTYLGVSVQGYPAGIIPTLNLERYFSEKSSLVYRLGANITDRQDFSSENDLEEGAGFGGGIGYRRHFYLNKGKIIVGFNTDVFNLWIDWQDDIGTPDERSGTTSVLVLQPWLEAGYFFNFKNSSSTLGITAGFGREFNVITNGDDVEQDFIASILVQYQFKISK